MFHVCGVAISSEEIHRLQKMLVRDRRAVESGVAYAVTSAIIRDAPSLSLAPEMAVALVQALDGAGASEFEALRTAAERQTQSAFAH